jgi:hypothetical protein
LYNNNPGKFHSVRSDNPVRQWNTFHIKMAGSMVWVWLNDKLVVDGPPLENFFARNAPLVPRGPIELQSCRGEVRFRNIYVGQIP